MSKTDPMQRRSAPQPGRETAARPAGTGRDWKKAAERRAGRASEDAERQPRGERGAEFLAAPEIVGADRLGRQDGLLRLRVGADDQRLRDLAQPPAGGDARDLPRGVRAVAAGADELRVGPAVDAVQ